MWKLCLSQDDQKCIIEKCRIEVICLKANPRHEVLYWIAPKITEHNKVFLASYTTLPKTDLVSDHFWLCLKMVHCNEVHGATAQLQLPVPGMWKIINYSR